MKAELQFTAQWSLSSTETTEENELFIRNGNIHDIGFVLSLSDTFIFFPFFKQQNKRDTTWWGVCSKKAWLKDKNHYDAEGAAMIFVSSLD